MSEIVYKQLFSHPELVRDLLACVIAADWAQALPTSAFERVNASYTSDHGKSRHQDVVWRASIGGEWVYVYILLEFQSSPERWMALRMLVYVGLLYQDLVAQHKLSKHGKLPPVLPIVFYHGRRPWTAALDIGDLMLPPPTGMERFQPHQRYLLVDQHHDDAFGNIVGLLLRVLHASTELQMKAAMAAFAQRVLQPDLYNARVSLTRWLQLTLREDRSGTSMNLEEDFIMTAKRKYKPEEVFTDEFFDALVLPAEEMFRQRKEEGRQEGERAALEAVLRDLLAGEQAGAESRIAQADSSQLRDWIKSLIAERRPAV
ncbi:Rpn family recombination-promoting nuclease/putative transposase [Duganella guangzhouensis]|nr:Rpn family recombination-promoting nuclease/putative transposase [Duganella guangzhouensis]